MRIKEFINGEFKDYVHYDNERNIPDLMDGLKTSQRKILYTFINYIGRDKIVVDKAGMRSAEKTNYAHGANNLMGVITNMAQVFPGSNNMNLLEPLGQFGNRLNHEASSERYISTRLSENYKKLFDEDDEHILIKLYDKKEEIEPKYYLPKLPLLLINGSNGTGNGFSSNVLQYNPKDIKEAVKESIKYGYVKKNLVPYMNGYTGSVTKNNLSGQITIKGKLEIKNTTTIIISELPPHWQLSQYKVHLNSLIDKKLIKDYENESTEDAWRFVIDCPRTTTQLDVETLYEKFKLIERTTETLTVWMPDSIPRIFETVEDLISVWTTYRLEWYEKRRLNSIKRVTDELEWLSTKKLFISWWNENASKLVKLKKDDLVSEVFDSVTENSEFIDRLLSIRVSNLGVEHIDDLEKEILTLENEKNVLINKTNIDIMKKELDEIKI